MSIRITILTLLVIGLALYAWRDWFQALCGLILLMAVIEHPDMPKKIMGIQGLNPWNLLMADVLLAWAVTRKREGLVWDMPRHIAFLLLLYLGVVGLSFARMMADPGQLGSYTAGGLVSEYLINCVKWVIPGLLLFDGCRTKGRLQLAMSCVLGLYLMLAVQVIRNVPLSMAMGSGSELSYVADKAIRNNIGYNRVNMSMLLSGASWAMLATLPLTKHRWQRILVVGAFVMVAYAQALTGGRMGYVAWGLLGLVLCLLRWRWMLLFISFVPIIVSIALPGVTERMLEGFGEMDVRGEETIDDAEVTSDRTLIWPFVIDKIMESPAFGYGREAMTRTGLAAEHADISFAHPHNAYLECLLDNGLLGFVLVMPFYALVVARAGRLFLDRAEPVCSLVGGVALALTLALLFAAMGSQTFYPREGAVGMWAAIGLMLRVSLVRSRAPVSAPRPVSVLPAALMCRPPAPTGVLAPMAHR